MKCRRVQLRLLDFSTGRLEAGTARRLAAHLERCAGCRGVLKREQRTAALLGRMGRVETRADAWPAIETAIRTRSLARRRPFWPRPLVWASGVTAAAVLAVSLAVPAHRTPAVPAAPDPLLSTLVPGTAAGLVPDRSRDPLMILEVKLNRALDRLSDDGS